ncbi:MAG: DUF6452 family protein [Polaribacter sp.]|nr:DUF6452 family protein [Polaribacter sp.]MDG1812179.1 DUF6452 family protein [Polaribacter sp.]MDG1994156.1 DUF6452 family protein [Polaribacter sp.]
MNKRFLILLIFTLAIISGCEKDDICLLPTTPKLILRFYDKANPTTLKSVESLSIWAEGKDTISKYRSVVLDSVAIPLNVNTTQTVYHLKANFVDGNMANNTSNTITINYNTIDKYVSRSCGFQTIFNSVTISSNNGWIQSFTPNSLTTINNEASAHVQIFH